MATESISELFNKMRILATKDISNGIVNYCYDDCCGCADCGNHTKTINIDENCKIEFGWNNWREYTNYIEIKYKFPHKDYFDTILDFTTSLDVTSTKHGFLSEWDKKILFHVLLHTIFELKGLKEDSPYQSDLNEYFGCDIE